MESSVRLCLFQMAVENFLLKMGTTTTTQGILQFLGDNLWRKLRRFLHRHLLQMVFVEVKTAGY